MRNIEEDLHWIYGLTAARFEVAAWALLCGEAGDDTEVVILGMRWTPQGYAYEADAKHMRMILEHFGFDSTTRHWL